MRILLFGSTGWIGSQLFNLLKIKNVEVIRARSRLNNYSDLVNELKDIKPTHVILAAGLTGRPNIDWCEDNKDLVMDVNVVGCSVLASHCCNNNIHLTYFGTGCIYEYDDKHPMPVICDSDNIGFVDVKNGFVEDDTPNFDKSFYSKTKILVEQIMVQYHALILRIRMPLSADLHPRNFISKITKYERVVDIPNSMTVLSDFLPLSIRMMNDGLTGKYNCVNPGVISHNQILKLYKKYIDKEFEWRNFSLGEQSKILKAGRSNNYLSVDKLLKKYKVPNIRDSIVKLFQNMKINLQK
jgi:dTDP-4-dehydrorhamnose reductase